MVALREPAVSIALQRIGHFGGARPRAVYAGVLPEPALMHLQSKIETVARRTGCDLPRSRFVPHVTLGRFPPVAAAEQPTLERAIIAGAGFRLAPFSVHDVVLYRSVQGARPRYDELARYPLI
jgi:RNA 2',3'-cyclic 3'-phosphodiesterase